MAQAKEKVRNIGVQVNPPKNVCNDKNCVFHGSLSVRGKIFEGVVVSDKPSKTVTVQWERTVFVPKYERYLKKRSKVHAHNPVCINAKEGDRVKIMECRKLSKTKSFTVIEKYESDKQ